MLIYIETHNATLKNSLSSALTLALSLYLFYFSPPLSLYLQYTQTHNIKHEHPQGSRWAMMGYNMRVYIIIMMCS
jgi:hypothetical protein